MANHIKAMYKSDNQEGTFLKSIATLRGSHGQNEKKGLQGDDASMRLQSLNGGAYLVR